MWTSVIVGAISGISGSLIAYESTSITIENGGLNWWQILIITIVPTLLGFLLDLAVNKGWITKDQAKTLKEKGKEVVEDYADDGKLNGSNKGKETENEETKSENKNKQ